MNAINLKTILLISLWIILVGCQTQQIKPTKPTLKITPQANGGICLDRENSAKLGTYILELERK